MNQHVDMISDAIHRVCFTFESANQAAKIGMHLCSDVGSDQRFAIFCAENNMGNKVCEGSAHNLCRPHSRAPGIVQNPTHSLRCGLEEYRQLRWLRFTSEPLIAEKQRQRGSAVTKTTNYMER